MSLWIGERLQNRGKAQSQSQSPAAVHLQPLSIYLSVYVIYFTSFCFLIPVSLIAFQILYLMFPTCAL